MKARQVKWVERNEADPSRRISRIGGDGFNHTIEEAIINMHQETCRYWMVHQGAPVWIVLDTRPGPAYLRAEDDISEPDILLSLARDEYTA
ncbi:DUF3892 domain-containing protein [Henriciella aquimarina]|uniref:DUF3892 domain-containing protein n=1 Tax=Henriciella aquimarina TaxID=545261 RepID=UPI000A0700AB|nr:DUF3892 domain-containing protein [Henriciella aquimarina]